MALGEAAKKWLNQFYVELSEEISKNMGLLLGQSVKLRDAMWQEVDSDILMAAIERPAVFNLIEIEEEYQGMAYLNFHKKDAIILGGTLAMLSEETLTEKIESLKLEGSEFDAFKEICNQLIGYLDRTATQILPKKVHFKQNETVFWEADKSSPINFEERAVLFPFPLSVGEERELKFQIIFPFSVINQFVASPEKATPKNTPGGAEGKIAVKKEEGPKKELGDDRAQEDEAPKEEKPAEEAGKKPQIALILLGAPNEELEKLFAENGYHFAHIRKLSELKPYLLDRSVRLVVLESNGNLDTAIQFCQKLSPLFKNTAIPIWIEGNDWNRDRVRRAVEAGAKYLITRPLDRDRVLAKIKCQLSSN